MRNRPALDRRRGSHTASSGGVGPSADQGVAETTNAAAGGGTHARVAEQGRSRASRSGGSGWAAEAGDRDEREHGEERIAPGARPPDDAEAPTSSARSRRSARSVAGDAPCASRSKSSPRSSRLSPATPSRRPTSASSERECGGRRERRERPARERVRAQACEHARPRRHRQLCGGGDGSALAQSSSVVPRPGVRESSSVSAVCRVCDHRAACDRREALDDADDVPGHLVALDRERDDPVRVRRRGDVRSHEHGQRPPVGRLLRPEASSGAVVRLYAIVVPCGATPAGADPAGEAARTGRPSTAGVPSFSTPCALGCSPVPAFAASRPELIRSSSSDASLARRTGCGRAARRAPRRASRRASPPGSRRAASGTMRAPPTSSPRVDTGSVKRLPAGSAVELQRREARRELRPSDASDVRSHRASHPSAVARAPAHRGR